MTQWNYRVIKRICKKSADIVYQIHEVYYLEDGSVDCWSDQPVEPLGISEKSLRNDIQSFLSAFRKPILEIHFLNGKATLIEERPNNTNPNLKQDYVDKASRASGYLNQILGNHLLLKQEPELRQAYEKVDQALADLYAVAGNPKATADV